MLRVLFVCMGNICRSPTAEGVLRKVLEDQGLGRLVEVDSAGTNGSHSGQRPDPRAQKAAKARGYDLSKLRAREIEPRDFDNYDFILAMDARNLQSLEKRCPDWHKEKLQRLLDYGTTETKDVPDPFYGGLQGFETVLDLVENGVQGFVAEMRRQGLGASIRR